MAVVTEGGVSCLHRYRSFHLNISPISLASGIIDRSRTQLCGIPQATEAFVALAWMGGCVFNVVGMPFRKWDWVEIEEVRVYGAF